MVRLPALSFALLACSCGGFSPAGDLLMAPGFNPEGQTQCKVKKSQEKPLIVEWPSADRGELEATVKSGTVVVRYDGCEMRVLSRCRAPGKYGYVPITPKADTVVITNDDELYANIPIYAAKFEAKLAQTGQLNVAMTMVGRYSTDQGEVTHEQLTGVCDGATHIISGLTVGAFEFFAGAGAEMGAGVDVMGAGAGARSAAKRETLTVDGNAAACATASGADTAAPHGCGALLRVEVAQLGQAKQLQQSCPDGSRWDGRSCRARVDTGCSAGLHFEPGKGCVAEIAAPGPGAGGPAATVPSTPSPGGPTEGAPSSDYRSLVTVTPTELKLAEPVAFEARSARILPECFPVLDAVARAMSAEPSLQLTVRGHTDSLGARESNVKLSQERAESVLKYLVDHGVEPARLEAKGYGPDMPIAANTSAAGRAMNARVDFYRQ